MLLIRIWLPAALGLAASAHAAPLNINVTGVKSWDALGSPVNERLDVLVAPNAVITGIEWNVTLTTAGSSWLSEMAVQFSNDPASATHTLIPGLGNDISGTGSYASSGVVPIAPIALGATGMLHLEFFETFDDAAGTIDGAWAGTLNLGDPTSIITMHYVPTGGTVGVMLAGLTAFQRRRRTATTPASPSTASEPGAGIRPS